MNIEQPVRHCCLTCSECKMKQKEIKKMVCVWNHAAMRPNIHVCKYYNHVNNDRKCIEGENTAKREAQSRLLKF